MNNKAVKHISVILALSWNVFFYAMDPAIEKVGRKIQAILDENAQKKQAIKAQNNSDEVPRMHKEEDARERFALLQAQQEQDKKANQPQKNLPRVGTSESLNMYIADLRKSKL